MVMDCEREFRASLVIRNGDFKRIWRDSTPITTASQTPYFVKESA